MTRKMLTIFVVILLIKSLIGKISRAYNMSSSIFMINLRVGKHFLVETEQEDSVEDEEHAKCAAECNVEIK